MGNLNQLPTVVVIYKKRKNGSGKVYMEIFKTKLGKKLLISLLNV